MNDATTTTISHSDMVFQVRTWWCSAEGGYNWTITAEDHDYVKSGKRLYTRPQHAEDAAKRHIERTF